jgi:ribosomal protein S27AE
VLEGSQDASSATVAAVRLRCPRCGLAITPRVAWLIVVHCPRCIAHAHLAVTLDTEHAERLQLSPPPA